MTGVLVSKFWSFPNFTQSIFPIVVFSLRYFMLLFLLLLLLLFRLYFIISYIIILPILQCFLPHFLLPDVVFFLSFLSASTLLYYFMNVLFLLFHCSFMTLLTSYCDCVIFFPAFSLWYCDWCYVAIINLYWCRIEADECSLSQVSGWFSLVIMMWLDWWGRSMCFE